MYGFRPAYPPSEPLDPYDPDLFTRRGIDPALSHRGSYLDALLMHQRHAQQVASGRADVHPIGPLLRPRMASAKIMYCALEEILHYGGEAPGLNGRRLAELPNSEHRDLCRFLGESLRTMRYHPGEDRKVEIPKSSGSGFRTLRIQDVEDRIVAKAVVMILQPLLDPTFSPGSFGFRSGRNTHHALAVMLSMIAAEGRTICVAADVANAFDAVPHERFLEICRKRLPRNVVTVIKRISATDPKRGLRQGSPASPFFFNVYADHFIDRAFHKCGNGGFLLRYADDLLVMCRTPAEAERARARLEQIARAAGLPLKPGTTIVDLRSGAPVDWLGYRIQWQGDEPSIMIAPKAWDSLSMAMEEAHLQPFPAIRAREIINPWFDHLGPCYPTADRDTVIAEVRRRALSQGFDEIPSVSAMHECWQHAFERWNQTRANPEYQLDQWLIRLSDWYDRLGATKWKGAGITIPRAIRRFRRLRAALHERLRKRALAKATKRGKPL